MRRLPVLHGYAGVEHGANYTGRVLQPAPPVYAPERTAQAIIDLVARPRREVVVGAIARLAKLQYQLAPALVEWGLARFIEFYLNRAEPSPVTAGNLYQPMPERAAVHGGWRWSLPRGASGKALTLGLAGAVAAGIMLAARRADGDVGNRRAQSAARPPRPLPGASGRTFDPARPTPPGLAQ